MILLLSCMVLNALNFYLPGFVEKIVGRFVSIPHVRISDYPEIKTLRRKIDAVDMKENFVEYALLKRELDKVRRDIQNEEMKKEAYRWTYAVASRYGTRVVLSVVSFVMFWCYRATPVVVLKEEWLEPVSSILSWPTHMPGALSFPVCWKNCKPILVPILDERRQILFDEIEKSDLMSSFRSGASGLRLPSWRKPNCVRHPSHPDILQELLYSFQGIDGTIVKFDKDTGYTIRNDVCFERSHIVYQLLELGFLFYSVQRILESQTECMVSRGLGSVVRDKLNDYHKHIAHLQAEGQPVGGVDIAVLTHLLPWARQKMLILQFVITILEEAKDKIGGAVLNPILEHLPHGNKMLRENFKDILCGASVPLYQMIWNWVVVGTLKDPFNEFFVKENLENTRTKAWQCQFSLRRNLIPNLFHSSTANLILNVGKSMHFINKFCPEMALRLATYKKEIFSIEGSQSLFVDIKCQQTERHKSRALLHHFIAAPSNSVQQFLSVIITCYWQYSVPIVSDCDLYSFVGIDGHSSLRLKRIQMESSETLLHIMKTKYDLKEFFIQLQEYVFLMRGHFARYFLELTHPFLRCSISEVTLAQVKKLLHTAIKASSPNVVSNSILDNIVVRYNEVTEDDFVGDAIVLQYKMEGPIKIMFQIFDLSYQKLFAFLWKKNCAIYTTSRAWKLTRALLKSYDFPNTIQLKLQNLFKANFHLMQILYHLDFYVLYEVMEKSASQFAEEFEMSRNIDEAVEFHAKMLRSILYGTFLEPDHEVGFSMSSLFIVQKWKLGFNETFYVLRPSKFKKRPYSESWELRAQLTNIFSLVDEIEEVFSSLLTDMNDITGGQMDDSEEIVVNAKIEILIRNNEAAIMNFTQFLKGSRHTDGLNAVCDRINFNDFYKFD